MLRHWKRWFLIFQTCCVTCADRKTYFQSLNGTRLRPLSERTGLTVRIYVLDGGQIEMSRRSEKTVWNSRRFYRGTTVYKPSTRVCLPHAFSFVTPSTFVIFLIHARHYWCLTWENNSKCTQEPFKKVASLTF